MKKILIYYRLNRLRPVGGPSGYLYNLKNGLDKIIENDLVIDFLPEVKEDLTIKRKLKATTNTILKKMLIVYRGIKHSMTIFTILNVKKSSIVDLNNYDAIHFHTTQDVYFLRDELKTYSGKVILTSHSPQPLSCEYIDGSLPLELKLFGKKYKELIKMDRFAFKRADIIIFPCEYSDEPYLNQWKEYKKIKYEKKQSYKYLLTGTTKPKINQNREEIRDKYGIPQDAFVLSYVGRHNQIKGYDRFVKIANKMLNSHKNVYLLVAGNIGPLEPQKHERWIEVGWVDNPHPIIASADIFILPNKETYFDLIFLEVLSIGIPIVASNTGGNKYFNRYEFDGIQLFNTEEECITCIERLMNLSKVELNNLMLENREIYAKKFTVDAFAKSYIDILKTIL